MCQTYYINISESESLKCDTNFKLTRYLISVISLDVKQMPVKLINRYRVNVHITDYFLNRDGHEVFTKQMFVNLLEHENLVCVKMQESQHYV